MSEALELQLQTYSFSSLDAFAEFIVSNDLKRASTEKLSRASGVPVDLLRRLQATPKFREALSRKLTLSILDIASEQQFLEDMRDISLDGEAEFDHRYKAGQLIMRQAGLLEGEKRQDAGDMGGNVFNFNFSIHNPEAEDVEARVIDEEGHDKALPGA